jgi:MHS family proline/betaine transporter-like MFS transporter
MSAAHEQTFVHHDLDEGSQSWRRAVIGAGIGNAVEWFDFAVYGLLATTLAQVFFPGQDETAGVLSTFAVFAAAFLIRPVGGAFFGHLGDRFGRRRVLAAVVVLMSAGTFSIGLLPSYGSIGVAAAYLLVFFRIIQGFSAGGELGGAASFLAEHSPAPRRGYVVSWLEFTTMLGFLLGSLAVLTLNLTLSDAQLVDWGWRIPFLIAGPIGLIGLYIRLKLDETPKFAALVEGGKVSSAPLRESITSGRTQIVQAIALAALVQVGSYFIIVFLQSHIEKSLGYSGTQASLSTTFTLAGLLLVIPFYGMLSDRFGRRPVMMFGCVGLVVLTYPLFLMFDGGSYPMVVSAHVILGALFGAYLPISICALTEVFPTRVRYGGFSIGYNLSAAAFGGSAPYFATWLVEATGDTLSPAYYLIAASIVSLVAVVSIPEAARKTLA